MPRIDKANGKTCKTLSILKREQIIINHFMTVTKIYNTFPKTSYRKNKS